MPHVTRAVRRPTRASVSTRIGALAVMLTVAACSAKTDTSQATAAAPAAGAGASSATPSADGAGATPAAGASNAGATASGGMSGMTGNPDQDFLRMMSDHHKGLIAMVHPTIEGKVASTAVRADARKLDKAQDAELDTMVTMLEKSFKDPYGPKVTPDNKAMVDSLAQQTSAAAYDRTFYRNVIAHHTAAIGMIDEALPKLTRPELKAMAQRMKADQTREIAEYRRKVTAG